MKSKKSAFCTLYFDIDNKAPDGNFYIGKTTEQIYTNDVNEEIHINIVDDDVAEYCLTDEADSRSCTNNWKEAISKEITTKDYNLGNDGEKIVYLYLKDSARNISNVRDASIILDTMPPTCTHNGDSTTWTSGNRTIYWGCSDTGAGCVPNYSGSSNTFSTTTKTSEISSYEIRDIVGNIRVCESRIADVYIDKKAPSCSIGGVPTI